MLAALKTHPFAVAAHFDSSVVLTYAVPEAALRPLLPTCLVPDTWQQHWGFVAVALVQTRELRPAGWPRWLGQDFFLVGYRVFVRYRTAAGRNLRGLYILRSETDRRRMVLAGNLLTHYRYHHIDLRYRAHGPDLEITSRRAALHATLHRPPGGMAQLPAGSPFTTWPEARRFAGPLPFTFTYDAARRRVLLVEGVREHWQPRPLEVREAHVGFLDHLALPEVRLASAFIVEDIPYRWEKGRTEQWPPQPNLPACRT